jgi:hypothetical protein
LSVAAAVFRVFPLKLFTKQLFTHAVFVGGGAAAAAAVGVGHCFNSILCTRCVS